MTYTLRTKDLGDTTLEAAVILLALDVIVAEAADWSARLMKNGSLFENSGASYN